MVFAMVGRMLQPFDPRKYVPSLIRRALLCSPAYKPLFDLNSASLKLVANLLFCLEVKIACAFQEEKPLPL